MQTAGPFCHHERFKCKDRRRVEENLVGPHGLGIRNKERNELNSVIQTTLLSETHDFSNQQEGNLHGKAQVMEAETTPASRKWAWKSPGR